MSFFIQGDRHHRYLHSFPTRRSSDLIFATSACLRLVSLTALFCLATVRTKALRFAFKVVGLRPSQGAMEQDRKSTRLNFSHRCISYADICLKKKTKKIAMY